MIEIDIQIYTIGQSAVPFQTLLYIVIFVFLIISIIGYLKYFKI